MSLEEDGYGYRVGAISQIRACSRLEYGGIRLCRTVVYYSEFIEIYFSRRIARKLQVIENSSLQDSYKADIQIQISYNYFKSNTKIPRDFYYHMS